MKENERITQLEAQLDEAEAARFELSLSLKQEKNLRYELEEFVRSIYKECNNLLTEEDKPDIDTVLASLAENIKVMARAYQIRL